MTELAILGAALLGLLYLKTKSKDVVAVDEGVEDPEGGRVEVKHGRGNDSVFPNHSRALTSNAGEPMMHPTANAQNDPLRPSIPQSFDDADVASSEIVPLMRKF